MIKRLKIYNFRGFEEHSLDFRPMTVVVGPNNAGKSTIVEALRLISIVANRYKHINFSDIPKWLDISRRMKGIKPSLKGMEINFKTMFFEYSPPPAVINAVFKSGEEIEIYLGDDEQIFAIIIDSSGKVVKTREKASKVDLPTIGILPRGNNTYTGLCSQSNGIIAFITSLQKSAKPIL